MGSLTNKTEENEMNTNLLGQDPLVADTYYPRDFEEILARVVCVDRSPNESVAPSRRGLRLHSRMPIIIAIASLAGASLAGAGLAAAAGGGVHTPGSAPAIRITPKISNGILPQWSPAGSGSTPPAGAVSGPPHWSPAGPGSVPPSPSS